MRQLAAILRLALSIPVAVTMAQNVQVIHVGQQAGTVTILGFDPPLVNAASGDIVSFVFDSVPSNHSVVQSTFDSPCQPLKGGFASGFVVVPAGASGPFPTWNLTITNDAEPIWFYCAQTQVRRECEGGFCADGQLAAHCEGGMVGVINFNAPISRQGLASFEAKAKAQTVVGSPKPALSDLPTAGSTFIDSTAHTSATPVSPTRVAASNNPGRRHVPVATIVGAVVGVAAAVTIASVSILYFRRCQHRRRAALRRDAHQRDSTSRHVGVPPTKRGSMMDDEEAASVEIAARDPVVEPSGRPSISMRYYDPDDPSTYPPSLPTIRRERTVPIQPPGIPEVYGTP
ncbi:hypothetical protein ONZ51_g6599 [Trametes cubensis]|uniref:Extracellular serine-rich protein n=1 Tax=Trametes cubensis TaxID=1111947 RepID=A0AAD7XAE8_9APHY|nr:hypothetical protein ONZ51_g6599 [Trametes cubensis]